MVDVFVTKCICTQYEGILLKEVVPYHELLEDWHLESNAHLPGVYNSGDVKAFEKQKARSDFTESCNKMPDSQTETQGGEVKSIKV